jgi:putative FmdB family regulatory protein
MPKYEYHCRKCGAIFEIIASLAEHDKAHPVCPKCKSEDVEQSYSTFFAKTSKKS